MPEQTIAAIRANPLPLADGSRLIRLPRPVGRGNASETHQVVLRKITDRTVLAQ